MSSETTEDYLEILYEFYEKNPQQKIRTTEISKCLQIAPPSVTEMIKKLAEKKFINYEPYGGVSLTPRGLRIGRVMKRRHRLVEYFLVEVLKLDPQNVHDLAHQIEHALTPEAEDALCRFLRIPEFSPHRGTFIPPCDHDIAQCPECIIANQSPKPKRREYEVHPLTALEGNQKGIVVFFRGPPSALAKIREKGIFQNHEVTLQTVKDTTRDVQLIVNKKTLSLSPKIAKRIFVKRINSSS